MQSAGRRFVLRQIAWSSFPNGVHPENYQGAPRRLGQALWAFRNPGTPGVSSAEYTQARNGICGLTAR